MKESRNPDQQTKTRTVVVGLGGRGVGMARRVAENPNYELVAICEHKQDRLNLVRQSDPFKNLPGYTSLLECLAKENFDAVAVITHDSAHAEIVVPCLDAGKFVFVEKPLEVTADKCRAIVEADRRAGGKTFVGFNLRFAPVYVKVKELIEQGEIGRVLTIQADEFYNGGRTYFRRWNRLREFGGGLWITKASHDFDLLYWFANRKPLSVYAVDKLSYYTPRPEVPLHCTDCPGKPDCPDGSKALPDFITPEDQALEAKHKKADNKSTSDLCLFNSDKDTFDHGIATVEFEDAIFATYTCNVVAGFSDRRIRVSGTKGTIDGSLSGKTITLRRRDPSGEEQIELPTVAGGHGGGDTHLFDAFYEFTQGRREPKVRPAEAMIPVLMGLAATKSGDEKRRIEMSELGL